MVAHLREAGLGALGGLGFVGLDDAPENPVAVAGYKATRKRRLTRGRKNASTVLSAARALVEPGFAHLKNWRILAKLRTDPARATTLLRALLVLTNLEVNRRQTSKTADWPPQRVRARPHPATPAPTSSKVTMANPPYGSGAHSFGQAPLLTALSNHTEIICSGLKPVLIG
jgi:hypothetical protein